MAQYEYLCKDCKKPFSKLMAFSDYEGAQVTSPECGSDNVEQQVSPFYPITSRKSAA